MISASVEAFFDAKTINDAIAKGKLRWLQSTAAILRREAIKEAKATAGRIQDSRLHKRRMRKVERSIRYALEEAGAVIGPSNEASRYAAETGERYEFGVAKTGRNPRHRTLQVGHGGPIRYASRGDKGNTVKPVKRPYGNPRKRIKVAYTRLDSGKQVARAQRILEEVYGPAMIPIDYPKLEFMRKTLEKNKALIAQGFEGAVRG